MSSKKKNFDVNDLEMDFVIKNPNGKQRSEITMGQKKINAKVKAQIDVLQHPKDSVEFMEHMLEQTKLVSNVRKQLKKFTRVSVIFTTIMCIASFCSWYVSLASAEQWNKMVQLEAKTSVQKQHGPSVQSSNTEETFEALQKISDMYTEETPYDEYINQTNGDIKVNQVCESLSVAVWGLVMAKARATFSLSDLTDAKKVRGKLSKLVYLGIMIAFAQVMKMSAESNYINHFIDQVEIKIDSSMNDSPLSKPHPNVKMGQIDYQEIREFRQKQVQDLIQSEGLNDFNFKQKVPKFDLQQVQSEISKQKSQKTVSSESKKRASWKKLTQIVSFVFAGSITGFCLFLSNKFHYELTQLENLNRIYNNKKAKVVVGEKNGNKILKDIQKFKLQGNISDSDEDEVESISSELSDEMKYQPPSFSDNDDKNGSIKNENLFNYSLYDISSNLDADEQEKKVEAPLLDHIQVKAPEVMYTQEQVQALLNQQKVQNQLSNPLACYQLPPVSTPITFQFQQVDIDQK